MLSIHFIDRALETGDHDRLLRELGRNGLVMPLPLRVRLLDSPIGATALGLRRLVELTYGPTALARQMIGVLIASQGPDGSVKDGDGRTCIVLTAALAAGLGRVLRDHGDRLGELKPETERAYGRALAVMGGMQGEDGLFASRADRTAEDRLLTSAFIAYLLIDEPAFAGLCRAHTLLSTLEDALDRADPCTAALIEMARLSRLAPNRLEPIVEPAASSRTGLYLAA